MPLQASSLSNRTFDLLVIGGGINGAGIARDAALRGLSVLLCEKDDFASGTSSCSTKLVHGGLRYLEQGRIGLVRQSLRERGTLLRTVPHLVRPLPLIFPVYRGSPPSLAMLRLGLILYDLLAGSRNIARHLPLDAAEIAARCPGLSVRGLSGGVLFYDAQMDDARVCLETVLDAEARGAVCLNYTEAASILENGGTVRGVLLRDRLTANEAEVTAKATVFAVGPWTAGLLGNVPWYRGPRLRLSKGVHLVVSRGLGETSRDGRGVPPAVIAPGRSPGRIFFVIPYRGRTLIGTTDDPFSGDPGRLTVSESERDELLADANRFLAGTPVTSRDVVSSFAGVRPLVEMRTNRGTSEISRKHEIVDCGNGAWAVIGGKYTTYRAVAEEAVDRIVRRLGVPSNPCETASRPLWGGEHFVSVEATVAHLRRMDAGRRADDASLEHLAETYGGRAPDVLAAAADVSSGWDRLYTEFPILRAEAAYAVKKEKALRAVDFIRRRTSLGLIAGTLPDGGRAVVDIMAVLSGWSAARIEQELALTRT